VPQRARFADGNCRQINYTRFMNRTLALATLLIATAAQAADPLWSLKTIANPPIPENSGQSPMDRFLLAKLQEKKLAFSKPADPRVQVRRLYFDLIGLPPPPDVVEAFVKNPTDAAYAKMVDDLLASPHYGERWARHWLDLVRYGESDGFERNAPRPQAWHYRDWVIRALNEDMPYDRFAKLQIAGDVLEPDDLSGTKATGFLVAGIHNTVLGSNKVANDTARQDELEDIIATVGQTFLGLSVQCARCHDHKFDPITQTDYYRLAASLNGVYHGELSVSPRPTEARLKLEAEVKTKLKDLGSKLVELEIAARKRLKLETIALPVKPIARWSFEGDAGDSIGGTATILRNGAKIERGRLIVDGKGAFAVTSPLKMDVNAKTLEVWVQLPTLDQGGGGSITLESNNGVIFDSIVFAERQRKKWMPGSNGFTRTRDINGSDETDNNGLIHIAISYGSDGRVTTYRNALPYGESYLTEKPPLFKAGESRILFGMRHTGGGNPFLRAEIEEARLYDHALSAAEVSASFSAGPNADALPAEKLLSALTLSERTSRDAYLKEKADLLRKLPPSLGAEKVFAVIGRKPEATHVLQRGNVEKKKAEVTPGGVAAIPGDAEFKISNEAGDGERRVKLAEWIARADNPLFARAIVNRLWQHHFGVGLIETPSDFGNNGGKPSHPELLDYLSGELIRNKYHLKAIHKMMVTSAAYRQASSPNAAAKAIDADNRLLWRKSPTRLDAEVVRDAMLEASGKLNRTSGGPGFADVRTYENSGTTFYEPVERLGPAFDRRTIYRFSPRGERSAILETFDCPDPSAQTPRRQVTTTPLQALALWNNALVLRLSRDLEARVAAKQPSTEARIEKMYRLTLARSPTAEEAKLAAELVAKHGLSALGRVLFNCNEFVVIE
jgi:hypothetical protein